MFKITEEEYDKMVAIISKCCCFKPHPCPYCSEIDCCDVQIIYKILRDHLEQSYIKPDEEKSGKELFGEKSGIDWDEDELPFRV